MNREAPSHLAQCATPQRHDDFEVVAPPELARLQREIADEAARCDVECIALQASSTHPMPVYDLTRMEPGLPQDDDMQADYRAALDKAVRYLDLRGLLVRPFPHMDWIVSFGRGK